ncbi:Erythromycin esterase [Kribbella flavida DSM 17836]|uniref:Erythromycin esterase n=1 Tax=Kribbella flavida (strain DSM 17836 / JCM 10339 / NBRC 14399) TaxID=479435 RepID=D2Q3T2_KRIFD|nr:erythromycin esterase family protein [Kribbella flavida]ADB35954.1 Erythromycin esterase [Kribbella flavida DSM 17836]
MKRNRRVAASLAAAALLTTAALPAATALGAAPRSDTAAPAHGQSTTAPYGAVVATQNPVPALNRAAYPLLSTDPTGPLRDLRPLVRMVGNAQVVGVGEATHSSSEFFTLKHRLFRALAEQRGFTAFSLEASWSTGVALDRYVVHGVGDPRAIMQHEFQGSYQFWNAEEYLDLIEWMRDYNRTHARKLHFVGNDLGYVSPALLDLVTASAGKVRPALVPELTRLYAGIRSGANAADWTAQYVAKPLAERLKTEAATRQALARVESLPASPGRTWTVQHARTIWQVAKFFAMDIEDPAVLPSAMRFRDQVMAENTAWWARTTGARTLLSAHNGHIALETSMPEQYPKIQGQFLREQLGKDYVAVGLSFDHGSFNALDVNDPNGAMRRFTLGPAAAGNNEHTLDRVAYRDYFVDLRTLPRSTKAWLQVKRPTRDIGTAYPWPDSKVALSASYDVLIHLAEVSAAHLR